MVLHKFITYISFTNTVTIGWLPSSLIKSVKCYKRNVMKKTLKLVQRQGEEQIIKHSATPVIKMCCIYCHM